MIDKLLNWASARIVAATVLALPLAAMAVTTEGYTDFGDTAGVVLWRAIGSDFHNSRVRNVAADGTVGDEYAMVANPNNNTTSWQRFASNMANAYTSPGLVLVYDLPGDGDSTNYSASVDCSFGPLSFGGLWVKTLAANDAVFTITGTGSRSTEFGAAGKSTLFKFEKSFTINRQGTSSFCGTATVDIDACATFTAQAYSGQVASVPVDSTLKLKGSGTLAVTTMNVVGTLDLSETTRPTIDGDVTLAADSTIVLPAGTTVDSTTPFVVCTGTLSVGGPVNVKIGTADPVSASLTVANGGITLIETTTTYTATISGDTAFSAISWEKGGVAATISDISTAILELSGSGKVTGLSGSPASIEIASGIVFDMTSVPNVGSIDLKGAGTFLFAANYPATVPAGLHYEYQGGVDSGSSQAIDGVAVRGTLTTTGFVGLTNFEIASGGTYEVASNGYATVSAKAQCKLSGNITIGEGATFVNAKTAGNNAADALNYGAQGCVITVRGTLNMGSTRWSLRSKSYHEIRLYDGAVICGEGQSGNGALDYIENESGAQIDTYGGNVTVSAGIRVRAGANVAFWVAEGATNTVSGTTLGAGTFSKSGTGTLNITGTIGNGALALNEGCVNVGSSMDVNIVCNNATGYVTASDNVVVGGTIALAGTSFTPNAGLTTFLQDSSAWHGTLSVPAIANDNLNASFLTTYGNSESLIALGGISGASTYIMASGSTTYNVGGLRIDGATEFNNGSSKSTVNFAKITGTNNLTLVGWSGCQEARYNLNKIEGYSGTLTIRNAITRDQGGTFTIGIGNIVTTGSTDPGSCVLPIVNTAVENPTGNVVYNLDNAQLNGAAANLEVKSDGIYVAMPTVTISVPKVPNTTVEVSVGGNPVSPATEGESTNTYSVVSGSTVTVTYSSDDYEVTGGSFEFTASDGYAVDATEVTTAAYVASITVGETTTKYATLQAAVTAAAAVENGKILLLGSAAGMVASVPAPASGGRVQFYIAANGNAEGTVNAPAGDYVMTTASETVQIGGSDYAATKYTVVEDKGWIYSVPGYWNHTGTWSEGATLGDDKVTLESEASYTAANPSDGQVVTLNMTLSFDDANDDDVDLQDAKAAVRLGADGDNFVFQLYTWDGSARVWTNATTEVNATTNTDYTFLLVLDLTNKTYTASILTGNGATTNALSVGGSTTIDFAYQAAVQPVQRIDFIGSGTLTSLTGSYEDALSLFVEGESVTLSGGSYELSAGEAAWLNAYGNKAAVSAVIAGLTSAQLSDAYLLNLDITGEFSYTFTVSDIDVGDGSVQVEVTLTRSGAFVESEQLKPINGTLSLSGTSALGTAFAPVAVEALTFDENKAFADGEATSTTTVTVDTTLSGAKFYKAVIQ